jgi:hypothetical protein
VRKVKIKALRKVYAAWVVAVKPRIPEGMRPISFRSWRRRIQ